MRSIGGVPLGEARIVNLDAVAELDAGELVDQHANAIALARWDQRLAADRVRDFRQRPPHLFPRV